MVDAVPTSSSGFTEPLTDFNDQAAVYGVESVRASIDDADATFDQAPQVAEQVRTVTPLVEWSTPVLPGSSPVPDVAARDVFDGWLGDYVHHLSKSSQTPEIMGVLAALSVLATCLQGRFEVAPKGGRTYRETLSLWTCLAYPPGGRKSQVMSGILRPIVRWEKLTNDRERKAIAANMAQRATMQKRIEALTQRAGKIDDPNELAGLQREIEDLQDAMPLERFASRLFTGDTTMERLQNMLVEQNGRMSVLADESGILQNMAGLYSGGAANIDVCLQGFSGNSIRVDRAGRKAHIDRPALSFGLMTQPGIFAEVAAKASFRHSGLLSRFLYGMPQSTVGSRDVRQSHDIPDDVADAYEVRIHSLLAGWVPEPGVTQKPTVLNLTDEAREMWFDFSQHLEDQQGPGGAFEGISDWTSKAPGTCARVAALLELSEFGLQAECVSESAMRRAIGLMEKLIPHAQAAMCALGADPVDQDADHVLRWLRVHGVDPGRVVQPVRRQELHNALSWKFKSLDKLTKALDKLKANGCIETNQVRNKGARPSVWVTLNPALI